MSPWPLHGQILWLHKARLLGQCHESSAGAVYRCSMPPASPAHTRYCFFFFNIRNFLTIDNTNTEYNHAPRSIQIHQNSTSWILFNIYHFKYTRCSLGLASLFDIFNGQYKVRGGIVSWHTPMSQFRAAPHHHPAPALCCVLYCVMCVTGVCTTTYTTLYNYNTHIYNIVSISASQ